MRYGPAIFITVLLANCWKALPVQAQTSQQRDQIPVESNWSSHLNWSTSKNMDYYSDYFTNLSSNLSYGFNKDLTLNVGFGYSQPIDDNEEKVRRYGFQDISVTASFDRLSRFSGSKLSSFVGLVLPASRASQKASLITSVEMGLNYSTRWKKLGIGTSHAFIFSHYQYNTADKFGYTPNAPYGFNNSVTGTLYIHPRFSISAGGGVYFYQTYAKENKQVNSLRSSARFLVTRHWNLSASYSWKDSLLTNNSFLDDDTTFASLAMGYSFQ